MTISQNDIENIAHLARLELSSEEKEKLTMDLANILEYVGELEKVDTSKIDIDFESMKPTNQLRVDEAGDSQIQEQILSQAPKRKQDYFEVKEVLE